MAYLKPKCKVKVPKNLSIDSGWDIAIVDVFAEQYAEENQIEVVAKIDNVQLDDPKDLRKLAKWCEKVAVFLEKYTTESSI